MGIRLLEKICYLSRAEIAMEDLCGNKIQVKHTFPYNPDSKTAPSTARHWARNSDPVVTLDNQSFAVTIVSLEARSEGGRAYKVIDQEHRCFDLREDQLIESLAAHGVQAGGAIPATFVWGVNGSQVKMVLVGGKVHTEMAANLAADKLEKQKIELNQAFSPDDLEIGGVYTKLDKNRSVHRAGGNRFVNSINLLFLGRVSFNDKVQYAFAEMPDSQWNQWLHPYHNMTKEQWESFTWQQKADWTWHTISKETYEKNKQYGIPDSYYDRPSPVTLYGKMPSGIQGKIGEAKELADKMRQNLEGVYEYANGHGESLTQKWWITELGNVIFPNESNSFGRDYYYASHTSRGHAEWLASLQKKHLELRDKIRSIRKQFNSKVLQWK